MKTTGFLLFSVMLFFSSGTAMAGIPIDCAGYPKGICTQEYDPHCGAIRKTYGNKCEFCNALVESGGQLELDYLGECRKGSALAGMPVDCSGYPTPVCPLIYDPHCGSIRKTYANKCEFCKAFVESGGKLELEYLGECRKGDKE